MASGFFLIFGIGLAIGAALIAIALILLIRASVLITADHGNAEQMIDPATGGVHTAHTTNPVPLVALRAGATELRPGGALCDVGPTILRLMGIEPPPEMTGRDLREP